MNWISSKMKKLIIESLSYRYERNRQKLNNKMHYEKWELQDIEREQNRIIELIDELKVND